MLILDIFVKFTKAPMLSPPKRASIDTYIIYHVIHPRAYSFRQGPYVRIRFMRQSPIAKSDQADLTDEEILLQAGIEATDSETWGT